MSDPKDTGADALAAEMQVTFDTDELTRFFDGFTPLEEIARALCAPLGGNGDSDR